MKQLIHCKYNLSLHTTETLNNVRKIDSFHSQLNVQRRDSVVLPLKLLVELPSKNGHALINNALSHSTVLWKPYIKENNRARDSWTSIIDLPSIDHHLYYFSKFKPSKVRQNIRLSSFLWLMDDTVHFKSRNNLIRKEVKSWIKASYRFFLVLIFEFRPDFFANDSELDKSKTEC